MLVSNIKSDFTFKTFETCYNETYGTMSSEDLEYFLTNSLLVTSDNVGNQK